LSIIQRCTIAGFAFALLRLEAAALGRRQESREDVVGGCDNMFSLFITTLIRERMDLVRFSFGNSGSVSDTTSKTRRSYTRRNGDPKFRRPSSLSLL
jgi:hypothetical protein